MREALSTEPFPAKRQQNLYREFRQEIPAAMVFLRKLESITIEHHAKPPITFRREPTEKGVRIYGPGVNQHWLILEGDFDAEAADLRLKHAQMKPRNSTVRLGVLPGGAVKGRLHATLPTQILTGLPVHVDASFFPLPDRKGIVLDGPEGDWNASAIDCDADLLATSLEPVSRALGAQRFWRLVRDAHAGRQRARRGAGHSFHVFWQAIAPRLASAVVMQTSRGEWRPVSETVLPAQKDPDDWSELLEDLGIPTVATPLRPIVAGMRSAIPFAPLTLGGMLDGLSRAGLNAGPFTRAELPAGLSDLKRRNMLRRRLAELVDPGNPAQRNGLRCIALWRATNNLYVSLLHSWLADGDTIDVFGQVIDELLINAGTQDPACKPILDLGDSWGVDQALETLGSPEGALSENGAQAGKVLGWFETRLDQLDANQLQTLRDLPILPTTQGLATPSVSVIPGGFADPLKVTKEVDRDIVVAHPALLRALDVRELSFADFVKEHVPDALRSGESVQPAALLALLAACAEHRWVVDEDAGVRRTLEQLAWVSCSDGYRRVPRNVYFDTEIVRTVLGEEAPKVNTKVSAEGAQADLLRAVGVRAVPRSADIIKRVKELVAEPPTQAHVDATVQILGYLQRDVTAIGSKPLCQLKALPWLPASDGKAWAAPQSVFFTHQRALFQHSGTFLSLSRSQQDDLRSALAALGVRQQPPVELVVNTVIEQVRRGELVEARIAAWLDSDRHWEHESVLQLRSVAWLPATDGSTRAPAELFRREHDLMPHLPVLAEELRRYGNLLDRLEVAVEPSAADALTLLLELAQTDGDQPPAAPQRKGIRACWRTLARDPDFDLSPLVGERVVIGGDNRLYAHDEVVINDLPSVAAAFGDEVQAFFIKQTDGESALRRAGVRVLSEVLRSRVVDTGPAMDGSRVADRIKKRVSQLARVVKREGGEWSDVLRFAAALTVTAYEWATVERYLEGVGEIDATSQENLAAHYLGEGELVVAISGSRIDWPEVAQSLRETLCRAGSPGAGAAIERALAAETNLEAGERLSKLGYAELDQEEWDELQRVVEEHDRRALAEAAARAAAAEQEAETDGIDDAGRHDQTHPTGTEESQPEKAVDTDRDPDRDDDDIEGDLDDEQTSGGDDAGVRPVDPPVPTPGLSGSGTLGLAGKSNGNGDRMNGKSANGNARHAGGGSANGNGNHAGAKSGGSAEHGSRGTEHANGRASGNGNGKAERLKGANGPRLKPATPRTAERQEHEYWLAIASSSSVSEDGRGEEGTREARRRREIDNAGMKLVERHETASGRHPMDPDQPNNPGFDLYSCDEAGEVLRYIEVKSLAGAWGDGLSFPKPTPTQWEKARIERERWWLYVVEYAESEHAVITRIQDPWGRTTRYVLDPGWKALAEEGPDLVDEEDDVELDDAA
jgi:hypothetical protein